MRTRKRVQFRLEWALVRLNGRNKTPLLILILLGFCFSTSTNAQRPATRRQSGGQVINTSDVSGLTPAAKDSLEAAVAALQSNTLSQAERAARAAVTAAPRSA